ncbi:helix-turn-helix transcriptional regulator [Persicobacter diffluens]|uniref:response regulator transcription factor n=1 Tax=Persicobacter diffluens TaxID=981 RepID=UPI0030C75FC2
MIRFYGNADLDESYTFCQRVYDTKKRDYYWMLTTTKICRTEDLLISTSLPFNQVNHLTKKVNLALNDNVFMRKNWEKFASLSKREREVFNLIATGKSNTEIGELLFVSRETIKRHRKNIYYKLEINSIAGVLRYARAFVL